MHHSEGILILYRASLGLEQCDEEVVCFLVSNLINRKYLSIFILTFSYTVYYLNTIASVSPWIFFVNIVIKVKVTMISKGIKY